MDQWLTVSEAAARLEVGQERVRQMLREGYFPGAIKRGRPWFIPVAEIDAYLDLPRGIPGRPRRL